jgi:hypothetical protein
VGLLPPSHADEAVRLLLEQCPELAPVSELLHCLPPNGTDELAGVVALLRKVILPLLLLSLPGSAVRGVFAHVIANGERLSMRDNALWAKVPEDGSELEDVLSRLYEVLELWASSPDEEVRYAVWAALATVGYRDLTAGDLVSHGGPQLTAMFRQGTPNPALPEVPSPTAQILAFRVVREDTKSRCHDRENGVPHSSR